MNVLLFLSKKRINSSGLAPIYCRITIHGRRAEFSTGISVKTSEWLDDRISQTHPQATVFNARLSSLKTRLFAIQLNLTLSDQPVSADAIRDVITKKADQAKTFVELMTEVVEIHQKAEKVAPSTKFSYRVRCKNILTFLNHDRKLNILANEITIELCQRFEQHFRKKGFSYGYINKHIFFFGQILKHGIRARQIKYNPIQSYEYKRDEEKPIIALSESEMQLMQKYKFASSRLQQVADLYLFQCYTGFAYVDLMQFDPGKNIHLIAGKNWIVQNRAKTTVEALIPVFKGTTRLLKKYNNRLPVITNQKYNCYIKEVAEVLGIEKHLTTHTARKTFGCIKLNEGFSIESVSRMMGHNSTAITQKTYARVTHVRINREQSALGIK